MAERIQRRRTAGWRMPEGAVYVGRPSRWGNPFKVGGQIILTGRRKGELTNAVDVVRLYRHALKRQPEAVALIRAELAGKDLACWCRVGDACHADLLLLVAAGLEP